LARKENRQRKENDKEDKPKENRKRELRTDNNQEDKRIKIGEEERTTVQGFQRPTMIELTVGKVAVGGNADLKDVCLWADKFPSWLSCMTRLRLRAWQVIVQSHRFVDLIQTFVDVDCTIIVARELKCCLRLLGSKHSNLTMMMVDGGPSGEVMEFARATKVETIITTQVGRRVPKGRMQTIIHVRHEKVGGVTTTRTRMSRLTR
jgi:hypothetical protein